MGDQNTVIERIARYLDSRPGASGHWATHVEDASNLLALIQQPDAAMADAGDTAIWIAMIDAALGARWSVPGALGGPQDSIDEGTDEEGEAPFRPGDVATRDTASWVGINEKEKPA